MAVDEAQGKPRPLWIPFSRASVNLAAGPCAARGLGAGCVSSWALVRRGPSSVPQPSTALSVNQSLAYFSLRFCLGHWSLLCTRHLSMCLKNSLPALRCECLSVTRWMKRIQIASASTLSQTCSLKHTTKKQWMQSHPDTQGHDHCRKHFFLAFLHIAPPKISIAGKQFKCMLRGQQIARIWLWLCLLFIVLLQANYSTFLKFIFKIGIMMQCLFGFS